MRIGPAEAARHVDAVQIRHHEIRNDRIGRLFGVVREQIVRPLEHPGAHAARGSQIRGEQLGVYHVVVEHVDRGHHRPVFVVRRSQYWQPWRTRTGP
ncbi:MAG: hypothetical protein DMD59_12895 [Gemmatimonadetes bacterium]|nr:MAG: hypothetical protein DMD59_12895 [Gemmatimonadota bacterium]